MAAAQAHDIVVIGSSAGGIDALARIAGQLPAGFPAAILVVLHVSADSDSQLPAILTRQGKLPALHPKSGTPIEYGQIYVAPPDRHIVVEPGRVQLSGEVRENRFRPAVDVLFRSAAIAYGPRVIGLVLTGSLDDGAAGLVAVKRCGGLAVVQDPEDAAFPSMPRAAIAAVEPDHLLRLDMAGDLLARLVATPAGAGRRAEMPSLLRVRWPGLAAPANGEHRSAGVGVQVGSPTAFVCPECGGGLFEVEDGRLTRYRCHVGHVFSPESLLASHGEALERALWTALRSLEERASLLQTMSEKAGSGCGTRSSQRFDARATELRSSARTIRELLKELPSPGAETRT